jgi:hypothetical protein
MAPHHLPLVQADLVCLLCGRRLGALVGLAAGRGNYAASGFFGFASSSGPRVVEQLRGRDQLRCRDCGGYGVVDEVEPLDAPAEPRPPRPNRRLLRERPRRGMHRQRGRYPFMRSPR